MGLIDCVDVTKRSAESPMRGRARKTTSKEEETMPTRSLRTRTPTNFYANQWAVDELNRQSSKEPIVLSDDDDDEEEETEIEDQKKRQEEESEDEVVEPSPAKRQKTKTTKAQPRKADTKKPAKKETPVAAVKKSTPAAKKAVTKKETQAASAKLAKKTETNSSTSVASPVKMLLPKKTAPSPAAKKLNEIDMEEEESPAVEEKKPSPVLKKTPPSNENGTGKITSNQNHTPATPVYTGPSEATLAAFTKQNKIVSAELKNLTNAINSGMMLVSTLWEQYQEIMERDMELREAAIKLAQKKNSAPEPKPVVEQLPPKVVLSGAIREEDDETGKESTDEEETQMSETHADTGESVNDEAEDNKEEDDKDEDDDNSKEGTPEEEDEEETKEEDAKEEEETKDEEEVADSESLTL